MRYFRSLLFLMAGLFSCGENSPSNLTFPVFPDWKQALLAAESNGKPILMIFDRHNSSVDAMAIFREANVLPFVKDRFNVVWAALDNEELLPHDTNLVDQKGYKIRTVGECYSDLMRRNFPKHYSPMYALFEPDGKVLRVRGKALFCGYVPAEDQAEVANFIKMLEAGLAFSPPSAH